ncbi:MAG: glycosyltransferase family 2 protein [Candidatus Coatesbacteria bacterium]|nr:glycosyltransferase family 2 protein [Candidatus Coatesbacteria bacterium]
MAERFAVLIPAYNADKTLEQVVAGAKRFVDTVIVVDDGSSDRTRKIAEARADRVLSHESNLGKGAALKTGLRWLRERGYEAAVTVDADTQHDPSCIPSFLKTYANTECDLVLGARPFALGKMPALRLIANRFSTFWVSFVCRRKILDSQCGFRLYRLAPLDFEALHCRGFDMETEVLIETCRRGGRVEAVEVPLIYRKGVGSHFGQIRDTLRVSRVIARYFLLWLRRK